MQSLRRSLVLVALVGTFLATTFLAGCVSSTSPSVAPRRSPLPNASPASSHPLVTVETRGGLCPKGACGSTIAIEADGRVHAIAPASAELGTAPDGVFEALATEIAQADFVALKGHPFTGTCPIAYDGQETIYTFTTASGAERIASCEFVVDPAAPLFLAVAAALASAAAPG